MPVVRDFARAGGKGFQLVPVVRDFARAGGKGFQLVPVVRDFARAGGKGFRPSSQSGKEHPNVSPFPPAISHFPHVAFVL